MCKLPFNWSVAFEEPEVFRKPVTHDVNNSVSRECLLCNNSQKGKPRCPNTSFSFLRNILSPEKCLSNINYGFLSVFL